MNKYKTPQEERYLCDTLYGVLAKKYMKNSILKSVKIVRIKDDMAFLECEPYDDAYSVEKAQRTLYRRRKTICEKLKVNMLVVDYYDEWTIVDGLEYSFISKDDNKQEEE